MLPSMARRATRTGLNAKLSDMSEEEKDIWGQEVFKALKARTAKSDDSPVVKGRMWSKRNGGKSTSIDSIMDSGSLFTIPREQVIFSIR